METTRQYLWASLPPTMSQTIFLTVLTQSLSVLSHRYSSIRPSQNRLDQYRVDIVVEIKKKAHKFIQLLSAKHSWNSHSVDVSDYIGVLVE